MVVELQSGLQRARVLWCRCGDTDSYRAAGRDPSPRAAKRHRYQQSAGADQRASVTAQRCQLQLVGQNHCSVRGFTRCPILERRQIRRHSLLLSCSRVAYIIDEPSSQTRAEDRRWVAKLYRAANLGSGRSKATLMLAATRLGRERTGLWESRPFLPWVRIQLARRRLLIRSLVQLRRRVA